MARSPHRLRNVFVLMIALLARESAAQTTIPTRQLTPPVATTSEPLGLILGARQLSDGRLLVNDGGRRRLLMFDRTLTHSTVIADSAGSTGFAYGAAASPTVASLGDSTLLLDRVAHGFVVLDPNGKQVRAAALPKASDQLYVGNSKSFIDPKGRLVYRAGAIPNPVRDSGQPVYVIRFADSAAVVRANFDTRAVDTAGRVKLPVLQENHNQRQPPGRQTVVLFGLSLNDDWTMTPDGTIAIIRSHDYHIDWVSMDGTRSSTPKMPFDWQRIDDDEKHHLADSAAKETQAFIDHARAAPPPPPRADGTVPDRTITGRADLVTGSIIIMAIDAIAVGAPLDRIPDFKQPFRVGSTLADTHGNIWILPVVSTHSVGGGLVYDVANRSGVLTERVELPPGRSIVAFGPDDTLYMMYKDGDVWRLEQRHIQR